MEQVLFEQVINPVVKLLTRHITRHIGYVICATKQFTQMTERMNDLKSKSKDVETRKNANVINRKEVPDGVEGWLTDVEKVREKVESISIDQDIGCLNMKMRYGLGRKASKATETIEKLITRNSEFVWTDAAIPTGRVDPKTAISSTSSTPSLSSLPTSSATSTPSLGDVFKSREMPFNDALKLLQQDYKSTQVIALCGMGGVGKTTMMKQLKQVANDKKMFSFIVKVVIGREPNMLAIQDDIALGIGGEKLRETTLSARADSLCEKFKKRLQVEKNKMLIILDNVWEKIDIKCIGLESPLPEGVKLLLTSRNSRICREIAASSIFQEVKVDVMKEKEAHNFFSQITRVSEQVDRDKYEIGCQVIKRCGGLPLAIELIATTLISQEKFVWNSTLQRLNKNNIDEDVQEIIKISYKYIRKEEDKEIFLLCGLFPGDSDIPIELLTRYAWGLRLLKDASTLGHARDMTNTCVQNLLNANLLIHSDDRGCVKMHDLVLAFVLSKVSMGNHPWIINHGDTSKWDRFETSESCKRISLTCLGMSEFPDHFKYPNLTFIQLIHGDPSLKFPTDFYENMKKLEVIAYFNMQFPLLPRSLQCSTNLHTLVLDKCRLMIDYCFARDLVNLEVLSFAHCNIYKLPSTIGNLRKLKLLDLTGCANLHIDDGVFNNLKSLEELYMRVSKGRIPVRFTDSNIEDLEKLLGQLSALEIEFVKEKTQLKNLSFKKLNKFQISIGCQLDNKEYSLQNTLKLVTNSSRELKDCKISELFEKTDNLQLEVMDMNSLEDVVSNHSYSFCNLRDLKVSNCGSLKYLFPNFVVCGLRKLERLEVSSCSILEALVDNNGGSEINAEVKFEKLKFLCLKRLPKLVSLFLVDNVVELPQLTELELDGLHNFTSIYPDNNNTTAQQPFFNRQVRISKLEKLEIRSMKKLKQIWGCEIESTNEEEVNNISLLREIKVEGCDSLVNLFPTNPMRLLNHLERLKVKKCGSIEAIFNIDLECVGKDEQLLLLRSSRLRSIKVFHSENLREVWRINGGENNSSTSLLIHEFESIDIRDCTMFTNVFTPTNAKSDMRGVGNASIDRVESDGVLKNISHVLIMQSTQSRRKKDDNISSVAFPSSNLLHSFHYLHELDLDGCNGVEVVFEIVNSSSNDQQPLLPNIQRLHLQKMDNMSHVWKCSNWNKFLILYKQSSFNNLTTIILENCNRIKYLFSPFVAKLLSNLKKIDIHSCDGMEEVVSNRDDNDEDEEITRDIIAAFFPHLESLNFSWLKNLKRIGGGETTTVFHDQFSHDGNVLWSLCQFSREITIHACDSLMEVFETQGINNNGNYSGGGIDSPAIPRLENINVFNIKKLVIVYCSLLNHAFTFSTLESLRQLEELKIDSCKAMEVVFEIDNCPSSRELVTTTHNQQPLLLPNLQSLELEFMDNMSYVWKCNNWNKFLILHNSSFNNLTIIKLSFCSRIKYLFSPLMAKLLSNLKEIMIFDCGDMEEVVSDRDDKDEDGEITTYTTTAFFPYLQTLSLDGLENLKRIGGGKTTSTSVFHDQFSHDGNIPWSLCQFSREITIHHCPSLMEVFEIQGTNYNGNYSGGGIDSSAIPRLENINVFNIKKMVITSCELLKHVFTFSTLESLRQLEELKIESCKTMEVIVKIENEEQQKDVEFPHLKSLELFNLPNLKGFFLGMNRFHWPLLEKVRISECPQMMAFTIGRSTTPKLKYIHTSLGKHNLECGLNFHMTTDLHQALLPSSESISLSSRTTLLKPLPWSFHNLVDLHCKSDWREKNIIPSNELLQLQALERIQVETCRHVEEVFEVEAMEGINTSDSETVVEIPNIRQMELVLLDSLKYIWKSSHHHVLEFPNLTKLTISVCKNLEHVFTSSMVGSLQQLQDLYICYCNSLLVIIKVEEEDEEEKDHPNMDVIVKVKEEEEEENKEETECDVKVKWIEFPCLKSINLRITRSLKGFCLGKYDFSFPSLHTLEIYECPQITVFTKGHVETPALNVIDTVFGMCYLREDINSFIKTKQHEGFHF
ncbi:hypothetical protein SSX86_000096 [Deinandra increscens subsp. villosa]|uniref:AAA+ ATPase domain-containing protein n=1 Tax=Deinandra increscens subsp. villosa TaxID=3103831 RepID=A0AAP0H9T1_9ASTR